MSKIAKALSVATLCAVMSMIDGCCIGGKGGFWVITPCPDTKISGDGECGLLPCVSVGAESIDSRAACLQGAASVGPPWYVTNHHHAKSVQVSILAIITLNGTTSRTLMPSITLRPDSDQFLGCSQSMTGSSIQTAAFELADHKWIK